jgi:hypothetical protein
MLAMQVQMQAMQAQIHELQVQMRATQASLASQEDRMKDLISPALSNIVMANNQAQNDK